MNTKARRNSVILVVLVFIAAIAFGILSRPGVNTQEITEYLEELAPAAQSHVQWLKDYQALTGMYGVLSQSQKVDELNKLLDRIEEIQIGIDQSAPPEVLKNIKEKWSEEGILLQRTMFLLSQGISRNNIDWISQAYELLLEAETERQQWQEALSNLLADNNIETEDNALSVYFD